MYVTGNFRNWMHFYELRASEDAQYEIRQYAHAIGMILEDHMPLSFRALTKGVT
jgi:thymidylate synthase ThyX